MDSTLEKPVTASEFEEESGWTAYFEDLDEKSSETGSYYCSPSMISDAASSPRRKLPHHDKSCLVVLSTFKNGKIPTTPYDASLEDTASSPINSPKVSLANKRRIFIDNLKSSSEGKRISLRNHQYRSINTDHAGLQQNKELKKRGVCVMPLSMLANYLH